jgi:hypothetical protein
VTCDRATARLTGSETQISDKRQHAARPEKRKNK